MRLQPLAAAIAASVFVFLAALSVARAGDLVFDHLAPGAIKLDGKLKEWPGTTAASDTIKAGKVSAVFGAGYDDAGIWVGAEVTKEGGVARTAGFGANEDCVSLLVAFPRAAVAHPTPEYDAYEVGFYAGVPGSSAGAVKVRGGRTLDGAKIVEAPRKGGGYSLEAFVPWSAFPEARRSRAGLRGALRVYDGDGTTLRSIKGTSTASIDSPAALGRLLIEPEQSIPAALASKKLGWKDVTWDVYADVAGDGSLERALFVGRTVFVLGPTYKEGKQWLGMELASDVARVEAKDVTGDGHADLLITTRARGASTARESLVVFTFTGGSKGAETPVKIFAHETSIEGSGGNALRNVVSFTGGKKPTATVSYLAAKGWDAASFGEPLAVDVEPLLLPWGTVKERVFAFVGGTFARDREVAQKGVAGPGPGATAGGGVAGTPGSGSTGGAGAKVAGGASPTPPTIQPTPSGDPVVAAFKTYRKDRGLAPDTAPKLEVPATVIVGKKGRVALFGRDLVIASGAADAGYAVVTMPRFASEKDIIEVTARDLTGDGRDEVLVRGVIRGKLTGVGEEKEVVREILSVYSPRGNGTAIGIANVFNAELARAMGSDRVEAQLRIVTAKGSTPGRIELSKGSAKGWTEKTWPFAAEAPSAQLEPIVVPWGTETTVMYTWTGEKFAR